MNWYNRLLKIADVKFFYHGTSAANIPAILSQGLHTANPKTRVWTPEHGKRDSTRNLESYPGIYLTENFGTANGAAGNSGRKLLGKGSGYVDKGIVMCRIETRSPHVKIDEDWMKEPEYFFGAVQKGIRFEGYALFGWITGGFTNIEQMSRKMLENYLYRDDEQEWKNKIEQEKRFIDAMNPYNVAYIKAYSRWKAAVSVARELSGYSSGATSTFAEHFPDLVGLDRNAEEQKMRQAALVFLQKAHRLTDLKQQESYTNNVRHDGDIGYSGANRIVLVATIHDYGPDSPQYTQYHQTVDVNFCSDQTALSHFVEDMRQRNGQYMLVKNRGQIIYDQKRPAENMEKPEEPATTQTPPASPVHNQSSQPIVSL